MLDPQLQARLWLNVSAIYNELGIYDLYRRDPAESQRQRRAGSGNPARTARGNDTKSKALRSEWYDKKICAELAKPELNVTDPAQALRMIREDLGDCTRCRAA